MARMLSSPAIFSFLKVAFALIYNLTATVTLSWVFISCHYVKCCLKAREIKNNPGHDACVAELKPYGTEKDCDIPLSVLLEIIK